MPYIFQVVFYLIIIHGFMYALLLPTSVYQSWIHERKFNLSNEALGQWVQDQLKLLVLSFVLLLVVVFGFFEIVKRRPEDWWLMSAAAWLLLTLFMSRILPTLIVPLFYPMKPLLDDALRKRLMKLVKKMGLKVKNIYEIALSRKTKKANAAVIGIGKSKRVVLGDTLIKNFTEEEIEVVTAHELAHYRENHINKSIFFNFVIILAGLYFFYCISPSLINQMNVASIIDLRFYPVLLLSLIVFNIVLQPIQNFYSRKNEKEADLIALKETKDQKSFISSMKKAGRDKFG